MRPIVSIVHLYALDKYVLTKISIGTNISIKLTSMLSTEFLGI